MATKITKEMVEEMKKLYNSGNPIRSVAKLISQKFGVRIGKSTIERYLKKVTKLRSKKEAMALRRGNPLPEDEIIKSYTKEKLSLKQISELFNASPSGIKWILLKNNVRLRDKWDGLRLRIGKYKKPKFNGNKIEGAYLMGLVLGDVAVRKISQFTIEANTSTSKKAMIDLLVETFSKHTDGVVFYPDRKKGGFRFYAFLDASFEFLLDVKKNVEVIRELEGEEFLSFLAGFFDADGCIVKTRRKDKIAYNIKIGNTNREVIGIIKQKLADYEVSSNIYIYALPGKWHRLNGRKILTTKSYWVLEIGKKSDVIKFLKLVKIRHKEKLKRKIEALSFYHS